MRVAVASVAVAKRRAVTRAFAQVDDDVTVTVAPSPSGVASQPNGFEEIHKGASNRLAAIQEAKPDADVWVAMENGVARLSPTTWIDVAVVLVRIAETDTVGTATSVGVEVPECLVTEALGARGGTVGKALQARVPGVDHQNPHGELTGGRASREDLLSQAVLTAYGIAERK